MTTPERRTNWRCHELLNAGEGPRGRSVKVRGYHVGQKSYDAGEAAEWAAEQLDVQDETMVGEDGERYIEVEGGGRFVVTSETVVKYRSAPL